MPPDVRFVFVGDPEWENTWVGVSPFVVDEVEYQKLLLLSREELALLVLRERCNS